MKIEEVIHSVVPIVFIALDRRVRPYFDLLDDEADVVWVTGIVEI